ncbi:DUF4129 domain-containing protein [Gordonia sp. NPDC003585]|uniref:DUF4129 domain-containing protein n=1 Tax=Gordonia sp. NPDC003585 TaxID=3154275 RepID=UPI0033A809AF
MIALAAGLDPDNEQAREWAKDELSKQEYQPKEPNWLQRAGENILEWFANTFTGLGDVSQPLTIIFWVLVAAVATWLIIYLARFVRRTPKKKTTDTETAQSVLGSEPMSAKQLREQAREALDGGDFDACVVAAMRAVAQRAFERRLLDDAPSLTAHEVATRLVRRFPDHTTRLRDCADLFDAIAYGDRHASRDQAHRALELESELASTRPEDDTEVADDRFAVPR